MMTPPTKEELLESGKMADEYRKAIAARAPFQVDTNDIFEIRAGRAAHLQKLRHLYSIPGPIPDTVSETDHEIPTHDGSSIKVRVYQPQNRDPDIGAPIVMMFHEGGWALGDLTDEDLNCRLFCKELGIVCVNVEYRLAPEHPFPAGVYDCWTALKWAISEAPSFHADPHRGLVVGGASAGGNLAAVIALKSRDENLDPPVTGQYLCVPVLLPSENVPQRFKEEYKSRTENTDDPILSVTDLPLVTTIYQPEHSSPLWDPFNHPKGHFDVAKAFFQVAGLDPLRDEAVLYERVLSEQNIPTRFCFYSGYGHMFWPNYPELEASNRFVKETLDGMKWLLET